MRYALLVLASMWWFLPFGTSYRVGPFGSGQACYAYAKQAQLYGRCTFMAD